MKIIKATAETITEIDPYKKIEKIGRTCYKSEDKITEDSCYKFVEGLIKRQHLAMLEHATVHFIVVSNYEKSVFEMLAPVERVRITQIAPVTFLVTLSLSHLNNPRWSTVQIMDDFKLSVKRNATVDNPYWTIRIIDDAELKEMLSGRGSTEDANSILKYHTLWTCKFICDRGVSHEIVRHRRSFAQESTRYCNYTQGKFGGELTFIEPSTWDSWSEDAKGWYTETLDVIEKAYFEMIEQGLQPQQARAILPNSLKTEVIMSAYMNEWDHFFDVRSRGTTGAPHPDMKYVADIALKLYEEFEHKTLIAD